MGKNSTEVRQERTLLLENISRVFEWSMAVFSLIWIILAIIDLTTGLSPFYSALFTVIWIIFIIDFALKAIIAPNKLTFLRSNWLTALSLLLPALRVFRFLRVFRTIRLLRSVGLLKVIASVNRGLGAFTVAARRYGVHYVLPLTVLVVFVFAAGMLYFENDSALLSAGHGSQPEGIHSYGDAVWWTIMLMTTIGSAYWPQTAEGKVLTVLLALYSLGIFGYITATLASIFVRSKERYAPSRNNG